MNTRKVYGCRFKCDQPTSFLQIRKIIADQIGRSFDWERLVEMGLKVGFNKNKTKFCWILYPILHEEKLQKFKWLKRYNLENKLLEIKCPVTIK